MSGWILGACLFAAVVYTLPALYAIWDWAGDTE